MKTIESTLSHLTDLSIVEDLRKVLREKDREFLPVEAKFKKAVHDLTTRMGKTTTDELMTAWDRQICSDLVYTGYLDFQTSMYALELISKHRDCSQRTQSRCFFATSISKLENKLHANLI